MINLTELLINLALLLVCYLYVIGIISATGAINRRLPRSFARKFLHMMIGNLCFIIPFFSFNSFPIEFSFFCGSPFYLVNFFGL